MGDFDSYNTKVGISQEGDVLFVKSGGTININGSVLDLTELGAIEGVTAGTVTASKAVIVDANKDVSQLRTLGVINLDAGSSGVAGTVDVFPSTASKGKLSLVCTDQTGDTTVTVNANAMGQATVVNVADPGAAASYVVQSTAALSLAEADVLDDASSAQVVASKAVIADANGKLNLMRLGGGAASASGLLFGVGTSANPTLSSVAGDNFVEIRAKTTATSGDNRLKYLRYDIGGAGASGECVRALTDLTAAVDTARGAHISLQADDTGYVSGLGVGVDAQLYIGDAAVAAGGTYAVNNSEIYSEGTNSDVSAVTELAFYRVANSGDGAGKATVDAKAYLFDLTGFSSGATNMWYDNQGGAPANVEEWIKVKTPSGDRWLALYNAVV